MFAESLLYICIVRYLTTCVLSVLSGEMCDCLLVYSMFNGRNAPRINIVNTGFCYLNVAVTVFQDTELILKKKLVSVYF